MRRYLPIAGAVVLTCMLAGASQPNAASAPAASPGSPSAPPCPAGSGTPGQPEPTALAASPGPTSSSGQVQELEAIQSGLPPGTASLGKAVRLDDYQIITVPNAERVVSATPDAPGGTTYTFLVQLESLDPTYSTSYNPLSFVMRDDQGFEYQPLFGSEARQPALSFGDLTTGEKVQGWLTMSGPATTSYVELVYRSDMAGEAIIRAAAP